MAYQPEHTEGPQLLGMLLMLGREATLVEESLWTPVEDRASGHPAPVAPDDPGDPNPNLAFLFLEVMSRAGVAAQW